MSLPKPWTFHSELTERRLSMIASRLLDVRHATLREMNDEFDDNYTRETTVFGRQRNMLIDLALSEPGFSISHAGMDVTITIGSVPFRFFTDDPDSPQKGGFFRRNQVDNLFPDEDQHPCMFRFVVDKALSEDDDDRVYFIGFNAQQQKVSEWEFRSGRGRLQSAGGDVPPTVPIAPATVGLKPKPEDAKTKTGDD